jgi:predicted phosphodiesterase
VERIALLGGIYSNHLALRGALADARQRGAEAVYCLGDLGGFGPHPDRVFPLLREAGVEVVQGNYDHAIGNGLDDCGCGYTDPRDNHYARLSYRYTLQNTSSENRRRLAACPSSIRLSLGGRRLLLCHGSPRRTNEFLWESTTPDGFLEKLMRDHQADAVFATHTGLKWKRLLSSGRLFANVGVLGRPENDGSRRVWYALVTAEGGDLKVEFVPVEYDAEELAREMRLEGLPGEFVETILSGWWTTCLEVLPAKERGRGKF